jgi:hypothetical protein
MVSAAAILDGADDLTVHGRERGIARQVFWRKGVDDIAEGGHGKLHGALGGGAQARRPGIIEVDGKRYPPDAVVREAQDHG